MDGEPDNNCSPVRSGVKPRPVCVRPAKRDAGVPLCRLWLRPEHSVLTGDIEDN